MNFNAILAILQIKGIITEAEAIEVAEHVAQAPQSTYYKDALETISGFIKPATRSVDAVSSGEPLAAPILPQVKKSTDNAKQ